MAHAPGGHGPRAFDRANDAGRIVCIHTALEPINVYQRDLDGMVVPTRLRCMNCDAVLDVIPGTGRRLAMRD